MEMANVTINDLPVSAPAGSTILQAAKQAGINIPTLCDHPALTPIGACRVCLVEVEGQRTLVTACTFPIAAGMVIQTETEQVIEARKLVLDLLFSERNHFCPFCEASGNCELQNLGYRYGIDHWKYPTFTKRFPIDASHKYLFMEHNRCILCARCERGCGDVVANHTLGLQSRGDQSMIHCDASLPWGESTCISCGTCLQVCPTGAIADKRSAFMGRDTQTEITKSTCSQCSVGCGIEIVTRSGNVLRIKGDWDAAVSGGRLCELGRFQPLFDQRERVTTPLLRRNGKLDPVTWEEALQAVADRLGSASSKEIGVLTSTSATNEALYLLARVLCDQLKTTNIGMLNKTTPKLVGQPQGYLTDILTSDVILVAGADPVNGQPVASFFVKRAVDKGARLIVVDDQVNGLMPFAYMSLGMADIERAVGIAEGATNPVILYGTGVSETAGRALKKLEGKGRFIPLEPGANTRATEALGFNNGFNPSSAKVLFALLGEEGPSGTDLLRQIGESTIVVAQSSFKSPFTERADVVLPMAIWSEREGSLTNTEGRVQKANKAVKPKGDAKPDWEILSLIAEKMGGKPGASLEEISVLANREIGQKEKRQ